MGLGLAQSVQQQQNQLFQGLQRLPQQFIAGKEAGQAFELREQQAQQQQTIFEQQIVQSEKDEVRKQRQADFRDIVSLQAATERTVKELSINNPTLLPQFIKGLKNNPQTKAMLERLGLQDAILFSPSPGEVGTIINNVPIPEKGRQEILERTGVDIGVGGIGDITTIGDKITYSFSGEERLKDFPDDVKKKVLEVQAKGGKLIEDIEGVDLSLLPDDAFVDIGFGNQKVRLLKPPKTLTTEEATKLATLQASKKGIKDLRSQIENKTLDPIVLNISAFTGALSPQIQKARVQLDFARESLARALSGAAVPETEVDRFRTLFAINITDTPETIMFKLNRTAELIDSIENNFRFGVSLKKIGKSIPGKLNEAQKDLDSISNQSQAAQQPPTSPEAETQFFEQQLGRPLTPSEIETLKSEGLI